MDAETLWNLVKDWPEAARFAGAYYSSSCRAICDGEGLKMLDHVAAHAFVGSGLAWLANTTGSCGTIIGPHSRHNGWYWDDGIMPPQRPVVREAPTLLHAVSAAILSHLPAKGTSNE